MTNKRTRKLTNPSNDALWLPNLPRYRQKWLCLWEDPSGLYLVNEDNEYMCAESWNPGDSGIEAKMRSAANSCGIYGGRAVWIKGRKVSSMESDDQMERLIDGKIPDEREEALLAIEEAYKEQNGIS